VVLLRRLDREGQRRVPAGLRSLFAERSDARERFGDAEFLLQYAYVGECGVAGWDDGVGDVVCGGAGWDFSYL
jgi:hypothetical protein